MAKQKSQVSSTILVSASASNITSTISASNITSTISGGSLSAIGTSLAKTNYHILGEDVEVSSGYYKDTNLVTNIATLNVLGKPFLDELHKNGYFFPIEIEEYLEKKFKWIERDKKIDDIIN